MIETNKGKTSSAAWLLMLAAMTAGMLGPARAEQAATEDPAKVFAEAKQAARIGPQDLTLIDQATLHLPEGKVFIPQPQAGRMLRAMGNPGEHSELQGLIFPRGEGGWFATLRFEKSGYIKDDDAKDWNADELLKSYREGTEANNAERRKMGVPEMEIVGWAEKPAYEADKHRLVWAMSSRDKNAPASAEQGVNYNTYALGREGYISLNLVTDLQDLSLHKGEAKNLLAALDFQDGKRYADFNSSTDHVAEYGLAALVLGVGAKKLGLLAVAFAFMAKFAKLIFLAVAGFGAVFAKFFKRKPKNLGLPE
jgi:uncharacterized membrane-anchored protein